MTDNCDNATNGIDNCDNQENRNYTEEELQDAKNRCYAPKCDGWSQGYAYHVLGYLITEVETRYFENYPHERDVKVGE